MAEGQVMISGLYLGLRGWVEASGRGLDLGLWGMGWGFGKKL